MNSYIKFIEYYLPEKIIDNNYLSEKCNIDLDFLSNKVGIKNRHIADVNESIIDMAIKACSKLFINSSFQEDIDLLLVCTQNPDYNLPTTACILQDKLGIHNNCFAFDINLGCSGFIYSLIIAQSFLNNTNTKKALLIMADQYSKIIDYTDKNTASLFGDASSVCIIEKTNDKKGIIDFNWGTDGSGYDKLILYNSGIVKDPSKQTTLYMHGREIFKFSLKVAPDSINKILSQNNLTIDDIRFFIFHQANKYMLTEIQKRLNIKDEQMIIDMEDYGNTVSSTIPIAFKNLISSNKLKSGELIIMCGFGVGLSWGSVLYKY